MTFDQAEFTVRCEWGLPGLAQLGPISDVLVIVDVLSFSTAVDIAVANGAVILPYPMKDEAAVQYAAAKGAELALPLRMSSGFSLSPTSLQSIPREHRLVLPSRNGGALAFAGPGGKTFSACLRNSSAVAGFVTRLGSTFAVIPAGERWPEGEQRPCLEDWVGAGAVLSALPGRQSPEAELAIHAFRCYERDLHRALTECSSGKELIELGFASDVAIAAELNVSRSVPWLDGGAFVNHPDA
jgi:2-phosphosulfolactate phosphatase